MRVGTINRESTWPGLKLFSNSECNFEAQRALLLWMSPQTNSVVNVSIFLAAATTLNSQSGTTFFVILKVWTVYS